MLMMIILMIFFNDFDDDGDGDDDDFINGDGGGKLIFIITHAQKASMWKGDNNGDGENLHDVGTFMARCSQI